MLAETQKELVYLENQQRIWQKKILLAKDLLLRVTGNSPSLSSLEQSTLDVRRDASLIWEVLSDFSYDVSTLTDNTEILSYLFWRLSSFLPLDYIQLTLPDTQSSDNLWSVSFLKATGDKNFNITQKQYSAGRIQPCTALTFHHDRTQKIQSFVASPLIYLGKNRGVVGFAARDYYAWETLPENFYKQISKILSRKIYSNALLQSKERMQLIFADFASRLLEPFKKRAAEQGTELGYSFSGALLKEPRSYVVGELEQWLNLLAKDTLSHVGEPMVRIHFYEKGGQPLAQILSVNSPRLLGPELATYLKDRDNFPTIERKRDAYSVEIAFK